MYPHVLEVPYDYMQLQYTWLEQLVDRTYVPPFKPDCSKEEQALEAAVPKFTEYACSIHNVCR